MQRSLLLAGLLSMMAVGCNDDDTTDSDLLGGGCKSNPDLCDGDSVCDVTTNRCVQCVSDADCESGACSSRKCVECNTDDQCGDGGCFNHTCVECTSDAHCTGNPAGEACDSGTHTCVMCTDNGDCALNAAGAVCNTSTNSCWCTQHADCAASASGHLCNTGSHVCECKSVSDCAEYPYGQVCKASTCSQCASDSDCGSGKVCFADADKEKRCYPSACITSAYATSSAKPNWRGIYWGTLHEHTNWSLDAYFKSVEFLAGNSTATSYLYTPQGAYEFAQGKVTRDQEGKTVSMAGSALDWVAITDHSEFFDTQEACVFGDGEADTDFCKKYIDRTKPNTGSNTAQDYNGYIRQNQLVTEDPAYVCSNNLLFPGGNGGYACEHVRRDATLSTPYECSDLVDGATPCDDYVTTMWEESQRLADAYDTAGRNDSCKFATLNAFEYSSNITHKAGGSTTVGTVGNEHRNIIFRGAGNAASTRTTVTPYPLDYITFPTPSLLWAALERYCPSSGTSASTCRALAIPHNPNDSAGLKWDVTRDYDTKSTESTKPTDYGFARSRFEKLVEVYQHKGSSECLNSSQTGNDNGTTPYDSACEFELGTTTTGATATPPNATEASVTGLPNRSKDGPGYVRAGLGRGILNYFKKTGASFNAGKAFNPLQLGIIGATDSHNTTPGYTPEQNWHGNTGADDNTAGLRFAATRGAGATSTWNTQRYWNAGGLTAVHAKRNVREDIWDALNNREAYATSGDRIKLWFFLLPANDSTLWCARFKIDTSSGYNTAEAIRTAIANDAASNGSKPSGATMGGTVGERISTTNPRFIVFATKDIRFPPAENPSPKAEDTHDLAELDLVQTSVINDSSTEDVVFRFKSGTAGASLCKIFTTSDTTTVGTVTKTLGATLKDKKPHLWYARALETPTWSWRHYDCAAMGAAACKSAWPELCGTVIKNTCTYSNCQADGTCSDGTQCPDGVCTYNDSNTTDAQAVFRNTYVRIRERAWSSPVWYMP